MNTNATRAWAQALLDFPNLTFAAIDTTGLEDDADIIRIALMDGQGTLLSDRLIQPLRQPGQANTAYTGITNEQFLNALPLADVWNELREAFRGRYILAYGLLFLTQRLRENANAYRLPPLTLIGSCLMDRARFSYQAPTSLRLTEVCRRIGHALPQPATALDRLAAQRALLIAMSQGRSDVTQIPSAPDGVALEGDDDQQRNLKQRHDRFVRQLSDQEVTDRYVQETVKLRTLNQFGRHSEQFQGYPDTLIMNLCKRELERRGLPVPPMNPLPDSSSDAHHDDDDHPF